MGGWLYHVLGLRGTGPWYGFWSGFGSDLGEAAIAGGLVTVYRRHNCHVKGCWRIGRHPVEGTPYVVCGRHHPDGAPTHRHILAARRSPRLAAAKSGAVHR